MTSSPSQAFTHATKPTCSIAKTLFKLDCARLLNRPSFYVLLAIVWAFAAFFFATSIEDFLSIQAELISKNIDANIMRLVVVPFFRMLSIPALILMVCLSATALQLCSFSAFSPLQSSLQLPSSALIASKLAYLALLASIIVAMIGFMPLSLRLLTPLPLGYVLYCMLALWMLLFEAGLLSLLFAKRYAQGILVAFWALALLTISEISVRLLPEPLWLAKYLAYFSPISHFNRMSQGVLQLSDVVFFITIVIFVGSGLRRQFENDRLPS